MYDTDFREQGESQRSGARRRRQAFLVGGVILVVASVSLFFWFNSAHQSPGAGKTSAHIQNEKKKGFSRFPREAQAVLLQNIAQGLHLSTNQLTARLQTGESLQAIATQQDVVPSDLHELVIQAYQKAIARWQSVSSVTFSPNDILNQVMNAPPDALTYIVKTDCLGDPNPNS